MRSVNGVAGAFSLVAVQKNKLVSRADARAPR
jgi:hypothetical protein